MRLLQQDIHGKLLTKEFFKDIPPYAILSHTWGEDKEEVTFQDLLANSAEHKSGYKKIKFCGQQAARDDLQYFWVDTCCIDKTNSTELSEAINSMFSWYQNAAICYVYLSDVCHPSDLDSSRWFKRGWTLQELLAPEDMHFYNSDWEPIDTKANLSPTISRITSIPSRVISLNFSGNYSVAQVISWAAERKTTRVEDMAYCLFGILGINMPLLYREGSRAFERLQQEVMRVTTDHSLFTWRGTGDIRGPFAESPAEFRNCTDFARWKDPSSDFAMTNRGLRIELPLIRLEDGNFAAVLDCYSPQNRRLAIYLKKFEGERLSVYRRVRSAELRSIEPSEAIPAPETIYIAPAVQLILGRDRPIPQGNEYSLSIDYRSALAHGFRLQQYYNPDEKDGWKDSDDGVLVFTIINSGQYGGLWFRNSESGEQFGVALGVHNYDPWLDVTDIGLDETFENIVDIYYHFRIPCQNPSSCRCQAPWKFEELVTKPLSSGLIAQAQIRANERKKRSFEVEVKFKVVSK